MKVYDFDGTIYNGQSSIEFYLFCYKRNKQMKYELFKSFVELYNLVFFDQKNEDNKYWYFLKFLNVDDMESLIEDFWIKNINKIKSWYLFNQQENDVIISLTPEFLLNAVCKKLDIKYLIGSKVNMENGQFLLKPCEKEEKIVRFKELFGSVIPDEFYTDRKLLDAPMLEYAKKGFIVKGNKIIPYKK